MKLNIAIIITTRNRKEDLNITLNKLIELEVTNTPIYIVDDNSDSEIIDKKILEKFYKIEIQRNTVQRGLIVNRNYLAQWASEDILISLDDDSCFIRKPNLGDLISYFELNPKVCAVEFDNYELGQVISRKNNNNNELMKTYTGFGHAIHKKRFLNIGGYREYFVHMCEERDFCQRAWRLGMEVRHYTSIKVLHRRTKVERHYDRNLFYLVRNTIIFNILNLLIGRKYKIPLMFIYFLFIWKEGAGRKRIVLNGLIDGLKVSLKHWDERSQLTKNQYLEYSKLK